MTETSDETPKFFLYTSSLVLGYSLLERSRSNGTRKGRFYPDDDYYAYASMVFEALPDAENDCFEANLREAYGLFDDQDEVYRKRFYDLSDQVTALALYLTDALGQKVDCTEIRLEDLSAKYNDQSEHWLHVTLK